VKKLCLLVSTAATLVGCGGGVQNRLNSPNTPAPAQKAGVQVTTPANNSVVGTSVQFAATATTTCPKGVATIGVYTAPNALAFTANGSTLNTSVNLSPGTYNTVVQAWDNCGGASTAPVAITVKAGIASTGSPAAPVYPGTTFSNLQQAGGWNGYALLPSSYAICSSCTSGGPQTTWSLKQGVGSPSLSGSAAQFSIGGKTVYSDALWNNHLIGDFSSHGISDTNHQIAANAHNFVYDVYFYTSSLSVSQALEFDINLFVNGKSFIWGHECRIAGGNQWDIWDNPGQKWHPTGVPCNPINGGWNHLTLQAQRTSDDHLLFQSITLNGQTSTLNYYESPTSTGWNGITINYQMDGNGAQVPYSVYLDKLNFSYW
jgi:hypothetical protein